jgi:hypothetical protein
MDLIAIKIVESHATLQTDTCAPQVTELIWLIQLNVTLEIKKHASGTEVNHVISQEISHGVISTIQLLSYVQQMME